MNKTPVLALYLALILFSMPVFATVRTDCNFRDCNSNGWTSVDLQGPWRADTRCDGGDCLTRGWRSDDNFGGWVEVICGSTRGGIQSCTHEGWQVRQFSRQYGFTQSRVFCNRGDCFRSGWTEEWRGGHSETGCYNGDCLHFGWETRDSRGVRRVLCQWNDCFRYGWTTD